jgi:hypothetical protein
MSLLNYPVNYNEGRTKDPRGYIDYDIPLLLELGILKRAGGKPTLNPRLKITPAEIATFLNWVANNKRGTMPIALKKILCLKRAAIVNSALSSGTSAGLRTAHAGRLREIDDLLAAGGLGSCDGRAAPSAQPSALTDPTAFTTPISIAPLSVTANIDGDSEISTASLASTIQSIQESLRRIEGVPAAAESAEYRELKKLILETLIPKAITTDTKLDEILAAIKALPASPEKAAAEKAAAAVASAADDGASHTAMMEQLAKLQAAVAKCCSGESFDKIKAMIDGAINGLRGDFGKSLNDIKSKLEEIKGFVPRTDIADKIDAVLAQLAAPDGDTTTIRSKLLEIEELLEGVGTSADVIRRLDEVASDLSGAIVGEVRRSRDSVAGQLNTVLQTIIARFDELRPDGLLAELRALTELLRANFGTLRTSIDTGFTGTRENIASLRTEVAGMHRECAQSSALANRQIESLNASIAALRALIETQRPPADYLNPVLTAIAQQREALGAQIAALGEGDAELRRTLEARQAEVARLQAEVARLSAASAEKDGSLAAQAASIADRVAEIARIQGELEAQRASGATDARRIAELEASLEAKKMDCDKAVNQARRELGAKFSQERSKLDAELRELRELRTSVGKRNATQKAEIARLTSQIDSDRQQLEEFRNNLAILQNTKAAEIATIQANLEAARRNSESRRAEYTKALAALQAERDRIREEAGVHDTDFTAQIEALRGENAKKDAAIAALRSELEGAQTAAREQIASLESELKEIREGDGAGAGGNSLVSLRERVVAAEARAAAAEERLAAEAAAVKEAAAARMAELDGRLKAELAEAGRTISKLEATIRQLEDKIRSIQTTKIVRNTSGGSVGVGAIAGNLFVNNETGAIEMVKGSDGKLYRVTGADAGATAGAGAGAEPSRRASNADATVGSGGPRPLPGPANASRTRFRYGRGGPNGFGSRTARGLNPVANAAVAGAGTRARKFARRTRKARAA